MAKAYLLAAHLSCLSTIHLYTSTLCAICPLFISCGINLYL